MTPQMPQQFPQGQQTQQSQTQRPVPQMPQQAKFDLSKINWKLYGQAWNNFLNDFFPKKVPYFFQNMSTIGPKIPDWFNKLPSDEQLAYGVIMVGFVLIALGTVFTFVL